MDLDLYLVTIIEHVSGMIESEGTRIQASAKVYMVVQLV